MFGSRLRLRARSPARVVGGEGYHCAVAPPSTDPATEQPLRLFLLDGHSLAYRAFFALPTTLATTTGQVTNAVYGFTSMLIKLLAEERPDLIAVAFDVGKPTVRLAKYAEYKAGRRETPDEFRQQLGLIEEVVETLRIPDAPRDRSRGGRRDRARSPSGRPRRGSRRRSSPPTGTSSSSSGRGSG